MAEKITNNKKIVNKKEKAKSSKAENLKLVIVESPAKAKTITKFLGKNYKVIASQGHLLDLPKSTIGIDVNNNFEMKYIPIRGKSTIKNQIIKEAKNSKAVYIATDPDREGEAISWHIANILKIDPQSKCRIEFNEITSNAVKDSIKNARAIDTNRVDAQQARRALDRLVGYGISPILWAKVKKGLSAGRVQSVASRLVVEREKEIEDFIPEEYWDFSIALKLKTNSKTIIEAKLVSINNKKIKVDNKKQADTIAKKIKSTEFIVEQIKTNKVKSSSKPPFTTSTLQQDAVNKLNFTTAKTMQIAQQLYEGININKKGSIGLITYMRTDSVRVSEEAIKAVRDEISEKFGTNYLPNSPKYYQGRKNAQDAHEAIRPSYVDLSPDKLHGLTNDQLKLYNLIYTRFLASQMADAEYETKTISFEGENIKLSSSVKNLVFDGFRKAYIDDDIKEKEDKKIPSNIKKDSLLLVDNVKQNQHFTEAKPHFTEASLVKEMEEKGIGRPSTYAPTISTIISRGYVSREKRTLYANELGTIVTNIMKDYFADIVNYDFTAKMENELDSVEDGTIEWKKVLSDFYPGFSKELDIAKAEIEKIEIKDEESDVICEKCGRKMVYKMAKFGRFLACPGFPECRNTKSIIEYIDVDCPECGGKLIKKKSKSNRVFYGCENYPKCEFVSWQKPTNIKCDICGSYMLEKGVKKNKATFICSNETCRRKLGKNLEENNE